MIKEIDCWIFNICISSCKNIKNDKIKNNDLRNKEEKKYEKNDQEKPKNINSNQNSE